MHCTKCKEDAVVSIVRGGEYFPLCDTCNKILETCTNHNFFFDHYLCPKQIQSQINKNMFEAKKLRVLGKSPWTKSK